MDSKPCSIFFFRFSFVNPKNPYFYVWNFDSLPWDSVRIIFGHPHDNIGHKPNHSANHMPSNDLLMKPGIYWNTSACLPTYWDTSTWNILEYIGIQALGIRPTYWNTSTWIILEYKHLEYVRRILEYKHLEYVQRILVSFRRFVPTYRSDVTTGVYFR